MMGNNLFAPLNFSVYIYKERFLGSRKKNYIKTTVQILTQVSLLSMQRQQSEQY